jgi:outer membrane protein assembly factor BamB
VSATPVNVDNIVYYPTWNGSFIALDYTTCSVQWQINVTDIIVKYAPLNALQTPGLLIDPVSRTSPQIDGNILYFGTVTHALLVAVDRITGRVLSKIQINSHPVACITQAPTVYNGHIFVGSSSREESAAGQPGYQCCSFAGNFMSLRFDRLLNIFTVNWNIPTVPSNQGWAGVSVWGSQPSIDRIRNQVYFATGQVYQDPSSFESCENKSSSCVPANIRYDAVIAADITTGIIRWQTRPISLDVWTIACGVFPFIPPIPGLCPNQVGPDANFGMAPTFIPSILSGLPRDVVIAGNKNGLLYSLSADTGAILWSSQTSPGSIFAGVSWGVAVDNNKIYFTGINALNTPFALQPSGQIINNSCYGAADLATGNILWETQAPDNAIAQVPPTVVGDLVLVGRTGNDDNPANFENTNGSLIALNKKTGKVLLNLPLDANFHGGIAVVDNYIMFGTGYAPFMGYTGNGSFYVMKVN